MTTLGTQSARHTMASNPEAHVWVEASAGTGKTRSLTDRILRLLLTGAPPDALFAITFTRTAAAEMQARVFRRLVDFASCDDAALDAALAELGEAPTAALRARARALLLEVLDSPHGLEIRTIHAAAQALLAAFPVEAGLPPRADPLDPRSAARLRRQALAAALEEPGLAADFERLAIEAGEGEITRRLPELVKVGEGDGPLAGAGGVEGFLRRLVGLPEDRTPREILEAAVTPPAFDDAAVAAFRDVIAVAGRKDSARAHACIEAWPSWSPAQRVENLAELLNLVLDSNGNRRGTANIAKRLAGGAAMFDRLFDAVEKVQETGRALAFVDHAGAWLRVARAVSRHYLQLKRAAAAVDFDDMVALAAGLIHQDGMANAIAERLDRRILHILVDEAQDTNEAQWRLIEGLASEFDTGAGQHGETRRTRFVVGDFKQAIFGFQGTDPEVFLSVRARWAKMTAAAGRPIANVPLNRNYRSSPLILALVDAVMKELGPGAIGLPEGEPLPLHEAHRADLPGRVLLFPPHVIATETGPEAEGNGAAADADEDLADPDFATAIASEIAAMVGETSPRRLMVTPRDGPPRPAGPGDVLILVQARRELMAALVRALHANGLPVAGVDRARLAEPLAVRDLLSLVRFVLQPADDLALAEVLTSPLGGLDHEAIRRVRQTGERLWPAFAASADPAHAAAQKLLRSALARADFATPHAFLETVLAEGGRARFLARLGPEADDGIASLLAEALAFEEENPATLEGFLAHVTASDEPIARDPDSAPGLVRLMTVHGAKGLEAPIVVLADAFRHRRPRDRSVTWTSPDGRHELPLIFGRQDRMPAAIARLDEAADRAEEAEHNRLLYVALTRAEQVLVVAGQLTARQAKARADKPATCTTWHDRIRQAMEAMGATPTGPADPGSGVLLDRGHWPAPGAATAVRASPPVPAWALAPPSPEPDRPRNLTPSAPSADDMPRPPPGPAQRAAAERGILLHRLFEHLPGLPPAARRAAGLRLLEAGRATDPELLLAEALAILDHPALAPLFAPESLAEAPIAGHVDGVTVAGTVDRLLVTPGRVAVIDFKTGLAVPADPADIHVSHLRQMAAYRAVLAAAFPGHAVEALLLYTAGPKLHLVPDKLLDAHWPPGKAGAEA